MKTQLSDDCYIFSTPSGRASGRLIITAHGIGVPEVPIIQNSAHFRVPAGMKLHFYAEDGRALLDPGIKRHIDYLQGFSEAEVIGEGSNCRDYILGKYKDDCYDVIDRRITENEMLWNYAPEFNNLFFSPCDVLTVRNRWLYPRSWMGVRLSTILSLLTQNGYPYTDIYCSFCRSHLWRTAPTSIMTLDYNVSGPNFKN